jgi:hypothetical protein
MVLLMLVERIQLEGEGIKNAAAVCGRKRRRRRGRR